MTIWKPSRPKSAPETSPVVCAHRGASAEQPENTEAAAEAAVVAGAAWIEFDVRPSADGLVVHHDPETAAGKRVAATSSAELRGVPSFEMFVGACGEMGLDIEMKTDDIGMALDRFVDLVSTEIDAHAAGRDHGAVIVTSFDQDALDAFGAARPDIATGVLFHDQSGEWAIARALEHGHSAIVPWHPLVTPNMCEAASEAGLASMTWTVNDRDEAIRVARAGIDAVIGDDPAMLLATLR